MNVIDRFTRGRQALTVWVVLTVVFFGVFAFVRVGASRGVTDQIDEAQSRAVAHAAVIGGAVEARPDSANVAFNRRELATLVQAEVFDDPTVARVRVYGSDGVLLFATDQEVRPGGIQVQSEDPGVTSAMEGTPYRATVTTDFTWSTVGAPGQQVELLQTFEPLRVQDRLSPAGVVEVDFFMDDLRAAAVGSSDRALTIIGVLGLLCLAGAILTLRRGATGKEEPSQEALEEVSAEAPETPETASEAAPPALVAEAAALRKELAAAQEGRVAAERALEETSQELTAVKTAADEQAHHVETLESDLATVRAELETARAAVPEEAPAATEELDDLRHRLAEAESRAQAAEEAASAAQAEALAARKEVEEAKRSTPPAAPEETNEVAAAPALIDPEALRRLEERIVAAEERAREAEERIEQVAPLSAEASDLRARLAKTAARKKLGPSSGTEG